MRRAWTWIGRTVGKWQSESYGRIDEIAADAVHVFDITAIGCVLHQTTARTDFLGDSL